MIKLTPIATALQFEQADQVADWKKTFTIHGGLNVDTGEFVPFKQVKKMLTKDEGLAINYALDSIAGAVEFGSVKLSEYSDFKKLFTDAKAIPPFVEALAAYGEMFWLNERHLHAFFDNLICDEMDCSTYEGIATWLENNAE